MSRGTEILLKARTHFRALRTVETLRKFAVPEWDCEVYYWPEMSVEERIAVYRHMKIGPDGLQQTPGVMLESAIENVVNRARDAFGERLFTEADAEGLRDTDPDVLQRIANEIGWGARVSLEDAEKN
jgi:hypothetical protein